MAGGAAVPVLRRSNHSTTVQVTGNDSVVAMVNPEVGTVSFFNAMTKSKSGSATFGANSQPEGVSIHPNDTTAFVLLRRAQRLAKVTAINTTSPVVDATRASTGSEPTGVALTPTGATAVVANHGDSSVTFIDTATMAAVGTTALAGPPRAVAITNDGDGDDSDERIFVTLFFGERTATGANDQGIVGKVVELNPSTRAVVRTIDLLPFVDTGFSTTALADGGFALPHVACSVNQLFGITLNGTKAYVPSVCASPQGPVNKFTNLFAAVSVIDLTTNLEDRGPTGSAVISKLAQEQGGPTSSLLGVPVGMSFVDGTNVGYLLSQAADVVQRLHYNPNIARGPIALGRDAMFEQISLRGAGGIKVPSGIVAGHQNGTLYVNNWADRSLSIVNLANQAVDPTGDGLVSEPKPTAGTPEARVLAGFKFFFTGTGRWSDRGVNSCASCHPDGLTDNVTWIFAAGPRQSTALDGMYGKTTPGDQRVFNWTGIFDEMHDFELNTRGTAGGKGAITEGAVPTDTPFNLTNGVLLPGFTAITRNDFLSGSTRAVVATRATLRDWDEVDDYGKTIRANRAPTSLDSGAVMRGRTIFETNNCHYCHGGQKWTSSRLPYTPSPDKNGSLPGVTGGPDAGTGLRTQTLDAGTGFAGRNTDNLKVDIERGLVLSDGGTVNVGPERVTCVLRDVGTFNLNDPAERKADGSPAQGFKGFNPPALTSVATGAPYLHHGLVRTLEELFAAPFAAHHQAASANFLANGGTTPQEQAQIADLVAFLKSIDESTPTFAIPPNQNLCVGY
jgi:DNA-binding beta-propeller fold protein YncE/cytochrome c peroxidase